MRTKLFVFLVLALVLASALVHGYEALGPWSSEVRLVGDISYKKSQPGDDYARERCKLDLYLPGKNGPFPTMVWFYGGSLQRGDKGDSHTKAMAELFASRGVAVAVADYRLSPRVKYPLYLEDAAAAVSWVYGNIKTYGGDPSQLFVAGHSAGAYLSLMLVLDPQWLDATGLDFGKIAGCISLGGQTFTHYAIREERGMENAELTPVIDAAAPCHHARRESPPILLVWSDGDSPDRIAENRYLEAILQKMGNVRVAVYEAQQRSHWTMIAKLPEQNDPLAGRMLDFILGKKQKADAAKSSIHPDRIIAQCEAAMGGREKFVSLETMRFHEIYPDHGDKPIIFEMKRPNLFRNPRSSIVFDGQRACFLKGRDGKSKAELVNPEEWKDFEVDIAFHFPAFFDHPAVFSGHDQIENHSVLKLTVNLPLGAEMSYYIDAETFLIVRASATISLYGQTHTAYRDFFDYRPVNGILLPHGFSYGSRNGQAKGRVKSIETNFAFDPEWVTIPLD